MFTTLLDFSQNLINTLSEFGSEMYDFIFRKITVDFLDIETSVFTLMFGSVFFIWALIKIIKSVT